MFDFLFKRKTWKQHFDEGIALGQSSSFAKAEACFLKAIRLAPNEPYPHYELGYTLSLMGRHQEALAEFLRTDTLARGFFQVQTEAYLSEQFLSHAINEEVLGLLRRLQRFNDTNASESDDAVAASRRVVAAAPQCALGHFYLAKAYWSREPALAEAAFRRCVELHPDETTAINARFQLGLMQQNSGNQAEAHTLWSAIVDDFPGNPHTKFAEMLLKSSAAEGSEAPEQSTN